MFGCLCGKFIAYLMILNYKRLSILLILVVLLLFSSCSRRMGYGILLWSIDDPPILSGTVLPVYIRSNIEQIWVVGVPEALRNNKSYDKIEIPLSQFEFVGNRKRAEARAEEFSYYALVYAENLQDGLPIRDAPDNNSRRVYRLRVGEIIKVLGKVRGNPPISATGDPLPGDWLKVLTSDGVTGFCFSFRLRLFDQIEGTVQNTNVSQGEVVRDTDLEMILSRTWSAEIYSQMVNSRRINTQLMERNYRFDPGQDTGVARIILPDLERQFIYERIIPDGERAWRFEGTTLNMVLRSNTTLAVQFTEGTGSRRTLLFVALPSGVNDIILQENARRENQFLTIYNQGPVFTSNNFGTITFLQTGDFTWTGYDLLVPQLFPVETNGTGRIDMDLFLTPSFEDRYNGAFSLRFTDIRTNNIFHFMYGLDNQGLRLEVIPSFGIEDSVVTRRSSSPMVLYFFRDSPL